MTLRWLVACACLALSPLAAAAQSAAARPAAEQVDAVTRLVAAVDQAAAAGDGAAIRAMISPALPAAPVSEFVQSLTFPRPTQSAVKERDRSATPDGKIRLLLETFTEREGEGRVYSWRVEIEPRGAIDGPWTIVGIERLTVVSGLFRLGLDGTTEYDVHNLSIAAPDLTLTVPSGFAFAAKTPDGPTALIVLGRGRIEFTPKAEAERGQLRIFSGSDAFKTDFETLFIRVNPAAFDRTVATAALKPRAVDAAHLRRATQGFETYLPKSFQIDLNDLSTSRWSLVPSYDDFVAEIVTSRYGALTYARATSEAEDISFFERRRHRNISIYASDAQLQERGRFFSEDDRREYDITRYEIDTSFAPDRSWVDGTAKLTLHPRSGYFSTITLRLAESLVVRSVTSPQYGRLLHLRVVGQNNVLIGFPATVVGDTDVDVIVTYGGRLPPQGIDREAIAVQQQERSSDDVIVVPPEPQYVYSNRSYWYPQAPTTDYATARISVTVPGELDVVASGAQQGAPQILDAAPGVKPRKRVVFEAKQPTRYLAVLISRLQSGNPVRLKLRDDDDPLLLSVAANPRQTSKIRGFTEKASDILTFYSSLMNDAPYETFALALTESDVPGGHSPAYFAMLNQPLPTSPFVWNNDPVAFQSYPSFFIAHEIAHQWWGQAIGWKNYHEQWISEGFAQYFAALYAERERGPDQFTSVLRQMRKWATDLSPQGPVYLGYRLGHIRGEGRTFRALVYNKGAMVLHMLRRLVGDEAFFTGLRDFYATWRYKKAGTDDFRAAMEKAAGQPLGRFFDMWIYGSGVPVIRFTSTVSGGDVTLHFEQKGPVFDVPLTVTLNYADGSSQDVIVPVMDRTVDRVFRLKGALRGVEINRDSAAIADIEK